MLRGRIGNLSLTRISLPIKVVLGVAMTLQIQSCLLASWTMGEGNVVVCNIVEEVDFVFLQKKTCSNGMNGSITPTFVEEATILVKSFKVIEVGF